MAKESRPDSSRDSGPDVAPQSARYWRRNQTLIAVLLAIWALVSYGLSILGAEALAGFRVGRLPAGFWWAQQGSMVVFVLLIFVYAWRMDRLDREHDVHEQGDPDAGGGA